jgi:DNA-binding Lrp family transcriptional regulator
VLDAIAGNGGSATQGQLRRALGLSCSVLLRHLHHLHDRDQVIRAGLDRNRSIIWKVAPTRVVLHRVTEYRQAPPGEGPQRVLDAVESLGGRASQARLARLLGLSPNTVHSHCLALERQDQLEQGGLDKTTSRRGSQIWRTPPARSRFSSQSGYTLRLTVPAR